MEWDEINEISHVVISRIGFKIVKTYLISSPTGVKHYSEYVCATRQWNAGDCVTGLHDQRSCECNPVTPVECVSLSFRSHPGVLALITYILCPNGIDMALAWWIWHDKVTYFLNSQFVQLHGWILVKHAIWMSVTWWRCGVRYCCGADAIIQHYDTAFKHVLGRNIMHE